MGRGAVRKNDELNSGLSSLDLYAYPFPDHLVLYTAFDDVAVVDFSQSAIDFNEFSKLMTSEEMPIGDVRALLYKFTKKDLFV